MVLDAIKAALANIANLPTVELHFYDYTEGETAGCFVVIGERSVFKEIEAFSAAALVAVARHIEGDTGPIEEWSSVRWDSLNAYPANSPQGASATLRPGEWAYFPSVERLGFQPPENLQRRIYLEPNLSGVEDCVACEARDHYVFCYWHTTG